MCLTHKIASACAAVIAAGLLSGCQFVSPTPAVEKMNSTPLVIDEAMQLRDWEPVTAAYQSGATVGGPTLFPVEPSPGLPSYVDMIAENNLFVVQVAFIPVTAVFQPPWTDVTYRGIRTEPSFTANPPIETDYENMDRYNMDTYR